MSELRVPDIGDDALKRLIVDNWSAAWNDGDLDAVDRLCDPGYRRCCRDMPERSRDDFKVEIALVRAAFPDLQLTIEDLVREGERVATKWHATGTNDGPFGDVPPTHERVSDGGLTLSTFRDGRVIRDWLTWDPEDLMRGLGIFTIGTRSVTDEHTAARARPASDAPARAEGHAGSDHGAVS